MSEPGQLDSDALKELVAQHGMDWVVDELGVGEVRDYIQAKYGFALAPDLEECFCLLEESHYPQSMLELLRDNQHQPWLTPNWE